MKVITLTHYFVTVLTTTLDLQKFVTIYVSTPVSSLGFWTTTTRLTHGEGLFTFSMISILSRFVYVRQKVWNFEATSLCPCLEQAVCVYWNALQCSFRLGKFTVTKLTKRGLEIFHTYPV